MDRINSANVNVVSGKRYFQDLNLAANTRGTQVNALFLNNAQEELMYIIETAGETGDSTNTTQVLAALRLLMQGVPLGETVFATPGAISFTVPANVYRLYVQAWGAGAGSFASTSSISSGGAGAGGWTSKLLTVTPGQVITGTVGAGGNAGSTSVAPTAGGNTTLSTLIANGAAIAGASLSSPARGGSGASASGGTDNRSGGDGTPGGLNGNTGGLGGAAMGGAVSANNGSSAQAGYFPGGGASGAGTGPGANTAQAGAAGANGMVKIQW